MKETTSTIESKETESISGQMDAPTTVNGVKASNMALATTSFLKQTENSKLKREFGKTVKDKNGLRISVTLKLMLRSCDIKK